MTSQGKLFAARAFPAKPALLGRPGDQWRTPRVRQHQGTVVPGPDGYTTQYKTLAGF